MQYSNFLNMRVPLKPPISNSQLIQKNKLYNSDNITQQITTMNNNMKNMNIQMSKQKQKYMNQSKQKYNNNNNININNINNNTNIHNNTNNITYPIKQKNNKSNNTSQSMIFTSNNNIKNQSINSINSITSLLNNHNNNSNSDKRFTFDKTNNTNNFIHINNNNINNSNNNLINNINNHNFNSTNKQYKTHQQNKQQNFARLSFYKKYKSPSNIKLDNKPYFSANTHLTNNLVNNNIISNNNNNNLVNNNNNNNNNNISSPTTPQKDSIQTNSQLKELKQSYNIIKNTNQSPLSPKIPSKIINDLNNKLYINSNNRKYSQDEKDKSNLSTNRQIENNNNKNTNFSNINININSNSNNNYSNISNTNSNNSNNSTKKEDQKSTINTQDKNSIKLPKFLQKNIQNKQSSNLSPKKSKQNNNQLQKTITSSSSSSQSNDLNSFTTLHVPNNLVTQKKTFNFNNFNFNNNNNISDTNKQLYNNIVNNNNNIVKPTQISQISQMFSKKKMEYTSSSYAKNANTPQNPPTKVDHPNFQFGRLSSPSSFNNRIKGQPCKKQFSLKDFQLINKIGKGAFGDVYLSKQVSLGFLCVLKKVSKKKIKQLKLQQNILRQIKIQSYLKHKHLTEIFGYFSDPQYLYLILQLLPDGSLNYSKKKKKVPQIQTSRYIKQICQGLRYMHKEDIIHRDIKPQNIFLYEDYLKIGDFGCAVFTQTLRRTIVGCLAYLSPEQLNNQLYDDKIDVWCIGILTYELITGKAPFQADIALLTREQKQMKLPELKFPEDLIITQNCKDFIKKLLQTNPEDRMTIQEALKHQFITKVVENDKKDEQEVYGVYQKLG